MTVVGLVVGSAAVAYAMGFFVGWKARDTRR